ncbi:MAG: J domain-containing protein [Bdellovibrionaceae bacterium]|nr:J domain-containing protein [Pseudobdellovibrionaceae bacterium]
MGTTVSFKQILEEKIKSPNRKSEGEGQATSDLDPAHLAYLLGNLETFHFRPRPAKIYPAPPKAAIPPHKLTQSQLESCAFFESHGFKLSPAFSRKELKKGFRALALRLHPDMNKGAPGPFIQLKTHYLALVTLFS